VRGGALVALAFVALAAVALTWFAIDRHPPEWDHANHLERAALCARDLSTGDTTAIIERSAFYPPVVPCLAGVLSRVLPSDLLAAQVVMLAFLAIGMAAVYLLGRRVDEPTGVLAAILFGSAPFVVFNTVRFQLDLPLTALVAVACWMTTRVEGFTHRGWSLALGVLVGIGLLVKPPFPVYVVPGALWVLTTRRRQQRFVNAALTVITAIVVSLAWYGPRLMGLPAQVANRSFKQAAESGHPDPFSPAGLSIYPATLPMFFGVAAGALFVVGLYVAWRRHMWLELVTVVVPFAAFFAIQNKNARYTMPIWPMAAVVAALALTTLRSRIRVGVTIIVLAIAAVQVSATAFAIPSRVGVAGTRLAMAIPAPPVREDWHHREILAAIARHAGTNVPATVSIVPNHAWFSTSNFRYYAVRDGQPLRIARAWDEAPVGIRYVVAKTGDVGPPWTEAKSRRATARLAEPDFARAFPLIERVPLPDGSVATVHARDLQAGVGGPPAVLADRLRIAFESSLSGFARDVAGLSVRVEHDDGILRGYVKRVELAVARAVVGELRKPRAAVLAVQDLRLVVDDLLVNPYTLVETNRFEPLDAGRARLVSGTVEAEDIQSFLAGLKGFANMRVRLQPDALSFAVKLPGPDISGRVRVLPAAGRPFALDAERIKLGGVPVPSLFVGWVFRNIDPSARLAERLPFPVEIARVRISTDAIRIGD
jgi:hypothetical protein